MHDRAPEEALLFFFLFPPPFPSFFLLKFVEELPTLAPPLFLINGKREYNLFGTLHVHIILS